MTIDFFTDDSIAVAGTTVRGQHADDLAPYDGFSLCHYCGDTASHVATCHKELADRLNISPERIIIPRQTHSVNVLVAEDGAYDVHPEDIDAVVTRIHGLCIGVNTADCVPVIIIDKVNKVAAAIHAGWRGAAGGIVTETMKRMVSIGGDPQHCTAYIAPCICTSCFEVGEEVASQFPAKYVNRTYGVKPHVDLKLFIRDSLDHCGISGGEIHVHPGCTRCEPDRYFSARRLGISSGRNFTFVMLK